MSDQHVRRKPRGVARIAGIVGGTEEQGRPLDRIDCQLGGRSIEEKEAEREAERMQLEAIETCQAHVWGAAQSTARKRGWH